MCACTQTHVCVHPCKCFCFPDKRDGYETACYDCAVCALNAPKYKSLDFSVMYFISVSLSLWYFMSSIHSSPCIHLSSRPNSIRVCFSAVSSTNRASTFSCSSKGFVPKAQETYSKAELYLLHSIQHTITNIQISLNKYLALPCLRESRQGSLMAETQDRRTICLCPTALMPVKYTIGLALNQSHFQSTLQN